MDNTYKDILYRQRPNSRYPKMIRSERAAQFAPFAALTGHKEALCETARITEQRPEIDEDTLAVLNYKIQSLLINNKNKQVEVIYFVEDSLKEGGHYERIVSIICSYDCYTKELVMKDKSRILIKNIIEINLV